MLRVASLRAYARRALKPRAIFWMRQAAMDSAPTLEKHLAQSRASCASYAWKRNLPPRISSVSKQRPPLVSGYQVTARKLLNSMARTAFSLPGFSHSDGLSPSQMKMAL